MNPVSERWASERRSIDTAALARQLIGRDPDKLESKVACWRCPFHEERTPSFKVTLGAGGRWVCWGCGQRGDAADLIQKLCNVDFVEARAQLLGLKVFNPKGSHEHSPLRTTSFKSSVPALEPPGPRFSTAEAEAFHNQSLETFAGDRGRAAQNALIARGILQTTAHQAHIGYALSDPRVPWKAPGILIPWYSWGQLAMLKLRVDPDHADKFPDRRPPKYLEIWRHPDKRFAPAVFPDTRFYPSIIGRTPIIVEGELDCILLRQELDGLPFVIITLGAASQTAALDGSLKREALDLLSCCNRWVVALDNDDAGEKAASRFLDATTKAMRLVPPEGKDWTDAKRQGVDIRDFITAELRWSEEP